MADGPGLALQLALVARLKADSALTGLVGGRVYDEPPQLVTFPYVRIGDIQVRQADTDGSRGHEVTFGIEVWSQPVAGRVEAARIGETIVELLHNASLTLSGFTAAWVFYLTQATAREPDGRTYRSAIAFTAMLDKA